MALTRWQPIFNRINTLSDILDEFGGQTGLPTIGDRRWLAPLDLYETPEAVVVDVVLPGVTEEQLDISVTGNTLTIRAETVPSAEAGEVGYQVRERAYGRCFRSITLPTQVEADGAEAVLAHGILHLTLPKAEVVRPRSISVTAVG